MEQDTGLLNLTTPGGARAVARCDLLGAAPYSDLPDGLFRAYLTPAFRKTQDTVAQWMREAGMDVRIDPAVNLVGRYDGRDPSEPALLIGSHIDSVRNGGFYDGPLGIMLGIEAVASLNNVGKRLPFAIEVIAFGDEEGSRFPAAMLTSRAVAGTLKAEALDLADASGVTLPNEGVDTATYLSAARAPGSLRAYLEAHIEQGPVLEAQGLAIGTVTGIVAQLRYRIDLAGEAGHAGTVTMALRRDAFAGAAEMALAIERIAEEAASDLVATVGWIEVAPGAPNVIAGSASFTLDLRAGDQARRDSAAEAMLAAIEAIAARRGLALSVTPLHDLPASPCDPALMELMDAAISDTGQRPFRLVSGAGHDAMVLSALCPTAMLFIRCRGGVSHHGEEHVEPADAEAALQAMLGFIERLGAQEAKAA